MTSALLRGWLFRVRPFRNVAWRQEGKEKNVMTPLDTWLENGYKRRDMNTPTLEQLTTATRAALVAAGIANPTEEQRNAYAIEAYETLAGHMASEEESGGPGWGLIARLADALADKPLFKAGDMVRTPMGEVQAVIQCDLHGCTVDNGTRGGARYAPERLELETLRAEWRRKTMAMFDSLA